MSATGPELVGLIGYIFLASFVMDLYGSWLLLAIITPIYALSALLLWSFTPWKIEMIPMSTGGRVVRDEEWGFRD